MRQIHAIRLADADFSEFGTVHSLKQPMPGGTGEDAIVRSAGEGWTDAFTRRPLIGSNGSLGLTLGEGGDFVTRQMERHMATQEALFCAAEPVVLAVAPPGAGERPQAGDIRAFVIEPGIAVVLHQGTWHDACRGIDRPSYYYWMATTGSGATWVDVEGGPVRVSTTPPERADA